MDNARRREGLPKPFSARRLDSREGICSRLEQIALDAECSPADQIKALKEISQIKGLNVGTIKDFRNASEAELQQFLREVLLPALHGADGLIVEDDLDEAISPGAGRSAGSAKSGIAVVPGGDGSADSPQRDL